MRAEDHSTESPCSALPSSALMGAFNDATGIDNIAWFNEPFFAHGSSDKNCWRAYSAGSFSATLCRRTTLGHCPCQHHCLVEPVSSSSFNVLHIHFTCYMHSRFLHAQSVLRLYDISAILKSRSTQVHLYDLITGPLRPRPHPPPPPLQLMPYIYSTSAIKQNHQQADSL